MVDLGSGTSALLDIDVALVPSQASGWRRQVAIVIDELRASSTLTVLIDRGCPQVAVTASLTEARRLARQRGALLAGEREGRTPPGFDVNNSPTELNRLPIAGRQVVLCTTNGTLVLSRLRQLPAVLVGCLLNAGAVAAAAFRLAQRYQASVGIACAGQRGRFVLDDAIAAGVIIHRLVAVAAKEGRGCAMSDAAQAALRFEAAYPDVLTALLESGSGRQLAALGLRNDIEFCSQVDISTTVPALQPGPYLTVVQLNEHVGPDALGSRASVTLS